MSTTKIGEIGVWSVDHMKVSTVVVIFTKGLRDVTIGGN